MEDQDYIQQVEALASNMAGSQRQHAERPVELITRGIVVGLWLARYHPEWAMPAAESFERHADLVGLPAELRGEGLEG